MNIVYKTTNTLNGKIYVGVHTRDRDSYIGSGKALRLAIEKYGHENFTRETIFEGTPEECLELEAFIVDEEFVARDDTYNLVEGSMAMVGAAFSGSNSAMAEPLPRREFVRSRHRAESGIGSRELSPAPRGTGKDRGTNGDGTEQSWVAAHGDERSSQFRLGVRSRTEVRPAHPADCSGQGGTENELSEPLSKSAVRRTRSFPHGA